MVFLVFPYPHFMEEETSANNWPSAHYHQGAKLFPEQNQTNTKGHFLNNYTFFFSLKSIHLSN